MMQTKHNHFTYLLHYIKNYCKFSKKEIKEMLIMTVAGAFVFTFNKWGIITFDIERGLANFIIAAIFMGIFFFGQIFVKKFVGQSLGYDMEYEYSPVSLMIMIVLAFLTYGLFPILLMGHTKMIQNDRRRLGGFRFAMKKLHFFNIYLMGYLFNYALILFILAPIYISTGSQFVYLLISYNVALIFYSLLPLPKNDGLVLFFRHRTLYYVVLGVIIIMSLLVLLGKIFSFVLAAILGLILGKIITAKMGGVDKWGKPKSK